jgi:hypothetical protein
MYFNIHSGCSSHPWDSPLRGLRSVSLPAKRSCAPAESQGQGLALLGASRMQRDLPSLGTILSQALTLTPARKLHDLDARDYAANLSVPGRLKSLHRRGPSGSMVCAPSADSLKRSCTQLYSAVARTSIRYPFAGYFSADGYPPLLRSRPHLSAGRMTVSRCL